MGASLPLAVIGTDGCSPFTRHLQQDPGNRSSGLTTNTNGQISGFLPAQTGGWSTWITGPGPDTVPLSLQYQFGTNFLGTWYSMIRTGTRKL
jgi:hypothetical protein